MDFGSTKAAICKGWKTTSKRGQFWQRIPWLEPNTWTGSCTARIYLQTKFRSFAKPKNPSRSFGMGPNWFKKIGMNLREMDPKSMISHITCVSHLSHISSYMLGKTVMEKEKDQSTIFDMAGSGFFYRPIGKKLTQYVDTHF